MRVELSMLAPLRPSLRKALGCKENTATEQAVRHNPNPLCHVGGYEVVVIFSNNISNISKIYKSGLAGPVVVGAPPQVRLI
jgi:hypothetical protein